MDGTKLAKYLNDFSDGNTLYSFDSRSQRVLSITRDAVGNSLTLEATHNKLKETVLSLLSNLQEALKEMIEDKASGETNGKGSRSE